MRVLVVDPAAYSPPYDAALCAALARRGAAVTLATSAFAHGERPAPEGYRLQESFHRRARGAPGTVRRRASRLLTHLADMRALGAEPADVRHYQWTPVPWLELAALGPGPRVLTVHNAAPRSDRLGRERATRAVIARMGALIVHSEYGRARLVQRGADPGRVHVIPHGAFAPPAAGALPPELQDDGSPVVLLFGLLRRYKGLATLLEAWRGITGAQLWVVGRPMMELPSRLPAGVRLVPRFVTPAETGALLRRADVITLPYADDPRIDGSGVLAAALGAGRATVVSAVGGLAGTGATRELAPGDAAALHEALRELLGDPAAREALAARARALAAGPLSWDAVADATLAVYASLHA